MSKHIAIAASKGGTGKTTTAWNLGFGLALAGAQVLMIDCDPQDNLKVIAGLAEVNGTLAAALDHGSIEPAEIREGVWLLPSGGRKLAQAAVSAEGLRAITTPLRRAVGAMDTSREFDFIIFDCPPEFGRLTTASVSLADYLLVPCVSTWLGLRSIAEMIAFIDAHERLARIESEHVGIVMTFYTTRKAGPEIVRQEAKKLFRSRLLRTIIRERAEIDYSQEAHQSVFEYAPHSDSAQDYSSLVKEVIKRMG
ncbi:MAG TPA: ParA family protein [Blastocatellia bacterium]|nr:ParA family protein [Blastocatellia bacterium]